MGSQIFRISTFQSLQNCRSGYRIALSFLILTLLAMIGLNACSSPEQKKKERLKVFEKFVTQVATHIFDRNPVTIRESITHLFREELTEPVIQKLQNEGNLPKTELGIVKIVTEAEENHTTNQVTVVSTKALGPVEMDVVPFQVTGTVTTQAKGKLEQPKTFSMRVTCKLNEQTGGWPQVVDISGLTTEAKKSASKTSTSTKKHKHRRH
ncbi:MAG: hypothetical protein HY711_01195 [Candidatus Melainabacteria bacterium]|nr:hypothetical protein [Candidatus Melainabacteria bacterium]